MTCIVGVSSSSNSPFMRSHISSLPSVVYHLSMLLPSCAPCAKLDLPFAHGFAASCETEFLWLSPLGLPLTTCTISGKVVRSARLITSYQSRTICTQYLPLKDEPSPVFSNIAEAVRDSQRHVIPAFSNAARAMLVDSRKLHPIDDYRLIDVVERQMITILVLSTVSPFGSLTLC